MVTVEAPQDRNGFKVAIICALPLEAEMVELILDKDWQDENKAYGKASRDPNAYTTGVIGRHNVVLAYMPGMGSNSAAAVASGVRSSFPEVDIAFVVGICGVVPNHPQTNEEIILGDCVISTSIVQYDFGREYPLGFRRKKDIEDSIGRANPEIRSYVSKLTTRRNRQNLTTQLIRHLELVQEMYDDLRRPSSKRDRLFDVTYKHEHHIPGETCAKCLLDFGTCTKDCDALRCEDKYLIQRDRLHNDENPGSTKPRIHFGRFGTANTVMKSGERRDKINEEDDITAFEMEGSGVWDTLPTILIKAACDYADSHKSKEWQSYAAATAAACLKAVLERWEAPAQSISNNMAGLSLQNQIPPSLPPRDAVAQGSASSSGPYLPARPQNFSWQYSPSPFPSASAPQMQKALGFYTTTASPPPPNQYSPRPSMFVPPPPSAGDLAASDRELIDAAGNGNLPRVKELHAFGANLNAYDGGAIVTTPLEAAAGSWKSFFDLLHNPLLGNYMGDSARQMMASRLAVINYLLVNGAKWESMPTGPTRTALQQALNEQAQRYQ